jgi:HEAT repeat protein
MSPNRVKKYVKLINYPSFLISNKKLLSNHVVLYLLKALESADPKLTADIENDLVNIGQRAIDPLITALESSNSKVKKHAAMALIRIGNDSIDPLLAEYGNKPEFAWMVEFISTEIKGTEASIAKDSYCESIAS